MNMFASAKSPKNHRHARSSIENKILEIEIMNLVEQLVPSSLQCGAQYEQLKDHVRKLDISYSEDLIRELKADNFRLNSALCSIQAECSILKKQNEDCTHALGQFQRTGEHAHHYFETLDMWNKLSSTGAELKRLEIELINLRAERSVLNRDKTELVDKLNCFLKRTIELETENINLSSTISDLRNQINSLMLEKSCNSIRKNEDAVDHTPQVQQFNSFAVEEKEKLADRISGLEAEINEWTVRSEFATYQHAMEMQTVKEEMGIKLHDMELKIEVLQREIDADSKKALILKLNDAESQRRKLLNKIQELRGNIRVFIRCRPFLPNEMAERDRPEPVFHFHKDDVSLSLKSFAVNLVTSSSNSKAMLGSMAQPFVFDRIFSTDATQEQVYQEVADLVQSALDGYRVCIMSYGQSGSGKTFTMTGSQQVSERQGIIPRTVADIITQSDTMISNGWEEILVSVSILELYNEDLRDLLEGFEGENRLPNTNAGSNLQNNSNNNNTAQNSKLKINRVNNRVVVSGLTSVLIDTSDCSLGMSQFADLLSQSAAARTTASTGMNEVSSRSHLIVMIEIQGRHSDGVTVMQGGLRLCDLAGSERLDRTGNLNDATRLKESVNINKSLSCLSDVFLALHSKAPHVPYRNSKLTMLLQDCLSGAGKALMLVSVSPTVASAQETLQSLRFADQARAIELGKASKNMFTMMPTPFSMPPPSFSNIGPGSAPTHSTASVTPISTPRHSPHTSIDSTGRSLPSNISPARNYTSTSGVPKATTPPRQTAKLFLKRNAMSDAYSIKSTSTSTSASLIGESSNHPGSMGFNRRALDSPNKSNNSKIPTSTARHTTGIPPLGKGRTHQRVVSGGDVYQIKSSLAKAKKKLYSSYEK